MINTVSNAGTDPKTQKGGITIMPKTIRSNFILLITEVPDNDRAAKMAAPAGQEIVFFKMNYTLPYSEFREIRSLQVKLQRSCYGRGKRVTTVIDLSEWIGRESDEYFDIVMKFLHDKRGGMDYIFTVGDASEEKAAGLMRTARKYMRGAVVRNDTFTSAEKLAEYIGSRYAEPDAAQLLAEMLRKPKMRDLLSYSAVDLMCEEMLSQSPVGVIRAFDAANYLRSDCSMPYITDRFTALEYAQKADTLLTGKEPGTAA